MRVGALDVSILVDAEGSFATIAEAFPALSSDEEWRLPVNAVLIRGAGATLLVDTGLGPEPRAFMPGCGSAAGCRPRAYRRQPRRGGSRRADAPARRSIESEGEELVVLGDVVVHELQLVDPDLVYVSEHDPELAAATRKQILGLLADRGTDAIVGHFHGPGRFSRNGEGFSWSSLSEEGETAVE